MSPSEKKLYNHLYYQRKKQQTLKERDSSNIAKAIMNLEAIYNEVSNRHLKEPTAYSKMILENLERPIRVLKQYKDLKDRFERRIDYVLNLLKSAIVHLQAEQKQEKENTNEYN